MKVIVLNNQSVFDLSVRYCGSALAAFEIAKHNGISVVANLVPGDQIEIPSVVDKDMVQYFGSKNHQPATGILRPETYEELGGISYWAINNNFIITTAE